MTRFLLIGLDGAEPSLVEQWMDSGHLPTLARLRDTGAFLPLRSTLPPATFPAWSSCVTGVNPGRHGLFDFTRLEPGSRELRFVNSSHRKAPALWQVLSEQGRRVVALGVPGSYPPDPVNGIMVSGFDSPVCTRIDSSFVYPRDCYDRVRTWSFADFQESHVKPGWHDRALPLLLSGISRKQRTAMDLLTGEDWDFFMVVFGESDTVAHHFWMFHDRNSPRHMPGNEDAILQVYHRLDTAVGTLWQAAGEDVVVGVVSDHGFGGAGTGVVHLNNWLHQKGYLGFTGNHNSTLKKLALRFVPERSQGALFRRLPGLAARAEGKARFANIDWATTRAWSEELNYFPSVRINLKGRDREGVVEPGDYEGFCEELRTALEAWPVVARVWRREEVYDGPYVDRAPDLILELALENGYSHSCLRSRPGGQAFRRITAQELMGGKERGMNGNHRRHGVLLLSRPVEAEDAAIEDVAPTVLDALGATSPGMEGRSLFSSERPSGVCGAVARQETEYSEEQAQRVEARLRALGYFE